MNYGAIVTVAVAIFGSLVTIIQVLVLYVLGDIRARVARLEDQMMNKKDL
jgi:hypothetical protein